MAEELFSDKHLAFDEVHTYGKKKRLCKSQIIEKLDLVQANAEEFLREKQESLKLQQRQLDEAVQEAMQTKEKREKKDEVVVRVSRALPATQNIYTKLSTYVVGIVTIGYTYKPLTREDHKKHAEENRLQKPKKSRTDGTRSLQQYQLAQGIDTGDKDRRGNKIIVKEPIAMPEYVCRLTNLPSTHAIQLDDCDTWILPSPDQFEKGFDELNLDVRLGHLRQVHVS